MANCQTFCTPNDCQILELGDIIYKKFICYCITIFNYANTQIISSTLKYQKLIKNFKKEAPTQAHPAHESTNADTS